MVEAWLSLPILPMNTTRNVTTLFYYNIISSLFLNTIFVSTFSLTDSLSCQCLRYLTLFSLKYGALPALHYYHIYYFCGSFPRWIKKIWGEKESELAQVCLGSMLFLLCNTQIQKMVGMNPNDSRWNNIVKTTTNTNKQMIRSRFLLDLYCLRVGRQLQATLQNLNVSMKHSLHN